MSYGTVQAEKMTTESGYSLGAGNASSFKNRIINGAMAIDQRYGSASTSLATSMAQNYVIDRMDWRIATGSATVQQVTDAPTGFTNSAKFTVTSAGSALGSGDFNMLQQSIEGFNVPDFNYGTASAVSLTLSFWVKSSLATTFGTALFVNSANPGGVTRSYPAEYTITAANTWQKVSITIPGDTAYSLVYAGTNNGAVSVRFGLGGGSTRQGTANTWSTSNVMGTSSMTNIMLTNGATWFVTGIQLEIGTVATSFDLRPYGTELQLCQRYGWGKNSAYGNTTNWNLMWYSGKGRVAITTPVPMRSSITAIFTGSTGGSFFSTNDDANYRNFNYDGCSSEANNGYPTLTLNLTDSGGGAATTGGAIAYLQNSRSIFFSSEL